MDEQGVHVAITADAASATEAVSALDTRLAALEKAFKGAATGAKDASESIEKSGGVFSKLTTHLKGIEEHAGKMADVGQKLGGMGGIFKGIGDKVSGLSGALGMVPGPMMAITAGLAAVGAGSAFLLDSAKKAAAFQSATTQLGLALHSAGENQAGLTRKLVAFADAQERATTYTRTQVVDSLAQLTTAGMNAAQAQAAMTAAENVAARTHMDLTRVVRSMQMAYHGNTTALQRYGIEVKNAHGKIMPFNQTMEELQQRFHGAARAAGEAGEGPMIRLSHTFETLQENVGMLVLPVLQKLADVLIHVVEAAEQAFHRWQVAAHAFYLRNKQAFDALGKVVEAVWTAIKNVTVAVWDAISAEVKMQIGVVMDVFTTFADLFTGHFNRLWSDVKHIFTDAFHNLTSSFGNFGQNLITIAERLGAALGHALSAPFSAIGDAMHGNFSKAKSDLGTALSGFHGLMAGLNWGGGAAASASSSGVSPHVDYGSSSFWSGATAPAGAHGAHGKHTAAAAHKSAAEAAKKERAAVHELATEVRQYMAAVDLEAKQHKISIAQEIADLKRFEATHKLTTDERMSVNRKIVALEAASARATQVAEHKKQAALKKTEQEEKHLEALKKHEEALAAHAAAKEKAELAKQQHAWEAYYKALEHRAQQWTSKSVGWIDSMFAHGKKGVNEFAATFKKMLKEIEQALLKSALFEMFMGGKGGNFGSLFMKNMGLGSGVGAAPGAAPAASGGGIASIATGALGLLGGGSKVGGALGGVANLLGGKGGGKTDGSAGIIGALIGPSAASQLASSLPTDSLMSMLFGVGAPGITGDLTGSGGVGGAGGIGGIGGAASVVGGGAGPGGGTLLGAATGGATGILGQLGSGAISKMFSGGLPSIFGALGFGKGSIFAGTSGSLSLGGAGLGAAAGYLFGNMFSQGAGGGSHDIWGSIGGTIGGLFGGPVGGLIGGALGSLFGHADNPAQMPDKYDTQNYGTIMANLWGAGAGRGSWGANGQQFNINPQIASIVQGITGGNVSGGNGGDGEIAAIEETLAKYAVPGTTKMGSNTPSWLAPMWNQLVSTFGISATGSGQVMAGQNGSGKDLTIQNVQGALGAQYSSNNTYTSLANLASQFFQNYLGQGNSTNTPVGGSGAPGAGFTGFWMNPITGAVSSSSSAPTDPGTWVNVMTGQIVQNAGTAISTLSMADVAAYSSNGMGGAPVASGSGLPTFALGTGVGTGKGGAPIPMPPIDGSAPGAAPILGGGAPRYGPGYGDVGVVRQPPSPVFHFTVNVAGSVTTESDLLANLQAKLTEIMASAQFAQNNALHGAMV